MEHCDNCFEELQNSDYTRTVYETPWDTVPTDKVFCSEKCEELYLYDGDFSYFYCEDCGRGICSQNPANGYHIQYRDRGDGTLLCLKCYEAELLMNGLDLDTLKEGTLPGMFFNVGELEGKGWEPVKTYFVDSEIIVREICKNVLTLDAEGYICIIGYERLATTGDEGTVTLYKKGEVRW